tara:strand:- start:10239 stop:10673 length:435 start_codon:yes stop_codon:yes gene_type:complete
MALIFSGCATTETRVQAEYAPSDDDTFSIEIKNTANATETALTVFESQLSTHDSVLHTGKPNPSRLVTIEFTKYTARNPTERVLAGAMAGSDTVSTFTMVQDAETGEVLGMVNHDTRNSTAVEGINSLLRTHADKVVEYLVPPL